MNSAVDNADSVPDAALIRVLYHDTPALNYFRERTGSIEVVLSTPYNKQGSLTR
jgi:hypothetical protein